MTPIVPISAGAAVIAAIAFAASPSSADTQIHGCIGAADPAQTTPNAQVSDPWISAALHVADGLCTEISLGESSIVIAVPCKASAVVAGYNLPLGVKVKAFWALDSGGSATNLGTPTGASFVWNVPMPYVFCGDGIELDVSCPPCGNLSMGGECSACQL